MPTAAAASFFDDADFTGSRHAHPLIDALTTRQMPPRMLISGNAGSGKTTILRGAQRFLARNGVPLLLLGPDTDVMSVPADSVLLVDDLHLLPPTQLEGLSVRAADPETALVATSRPWPNSHELASIARHLERSRPALVLGHVTRSDVLDYLAGTGREISAPCLDHILEVTAGVSWLVSAALSAHDERDCANDTDHLALGSMLEQSVAHRLGVVDPAVRRAVEAISVAAAEEKALAPELLGDPDGIVVQGYADGLLLRNGRPVPVVRTAVRASLTTRRLIEIVTAHPGGVDPSADRDDDWLSDVRDSRLGAALVERGDQAIDADPVRAAGFYRAAAEAGTSSADLHAKRAQAAWATGDIDGAAQLIDEAMAFGERDVAVDARLADVAVATWSMRGMLQTGCAVYDAIPPASAEASAREYIARVGVGDPRALEEQEQPAPSALTAPSTLTVAMRLVRRGLRASLRADEADAAVADLVRGSHLFTASRSTGPMPELPAVIAAVAAVSSGDITTARAVIDAAIDGHAGTPWMLSRLLLWRAWIALSLAQGGRAREDLDAALALAPTPTPRDDLLAQAIRVGLARRYEDAAALAAAWRRGRNSLLEADVDLYTLLPVAELVTAGARVGDETATLPLFAQARRIVESLGSPPIWTAHLRWAGIQRGILLDHPDYLAPHAHALVDAAPASRVAATMATAGRLWTSVLAGTVDADAVEASAQGLGAIGLRWDAARLARHGANRADDRKVSARLLACARELHPQEMRGTDAAAESADAPRPSAAAGLSERETDVARLVVQGKTYAEIGETIFISPRTAEHHIASIRRRLGATSRSDLIAKLRVVLSPSDPSSEGTA
jgi:DNA-binding CsgD family transcriptional regulator